MCCLDCESDGCVDIGFTTDSDGDRCSAYKYSPTWCGQYNDNDFMSEEICCACGGGATGGCLLKLVLSHSSLYPKHVSLHKRTSMF